jgi:EpsD family peptidyl-prolyl cis-trans isomerase
MTVSSYSARRCLAAGAWAALLSACGHGGGTPTQVAVRVNKDEISVHQLNEQLARVNATGMNEDQRVKAQMTVLEGLVDQDLLLAKAREKQLDRDPEVVSAIESARRQILAEAYVRKQIAPGAKPTEEEIRKYYEDNPTLFAERRIFALQEATVTGLTADQAAQVKAKLRDSGNLEEAVKWLKTQDVKVAANVGVRPAEQIPIRMLETLSKLRQGGVAVFDNPNNALNIVKVVSFQAAPVDEKSSHASIEQFLTNRKREELLRAEVKRLRDAAKIEYVGDFQKLAMQSDVGTAAGAAKPAAGNSAEGHSASTAKQADSVSNGLKGL